MKSPKPVPIKLHGIVKDIEESELAPDKWSDGRNVMFKAGAAVRSRGEAPFATTGRLFAADVVKFVDNGVTQYWVYACAYPGSTPGIGVTDGVSHWNITPSGWPTIVGDQGKLTIGIINGLVYINHPEFGPYYWDNDVTHVMAALPGWPADTVCKVMRTHKEFLMALCVDTPTLGLVEGLVMWSASSGTGIPLEWTPSPTNDAGDAIFAEVTGALVEGISVRDQFFCMKPNFTGVLQYVGGQFVFAKRQVFPSLGCLGPGAAVESGNIVYMVTGNLEFVKHDGTSFQNVLYGVMQDYLRQVINHEYPQNVMVWRNDGDGQIFVGYPTGTSKACTEAISFEVASGDCGIRDLPSVYSADFGAVGVVNVSWDAAEGTWDTDTMIWNQDASGYQPYSVMFASGVLGMLQVGGASTFWGPGGAIPVNSYLARGGIDFNGPENNTVFSGARPIVEGNNGDTLYFTFGAQEMIDGPVDLLPALPFTIGTSKKLDFFLDTMFLYVQIGSSGGAPWRVTGLHAWQRAGGRPS